MKTFKDLIVWQKAHELVLKVYKETKNFPAAEKYGLVSQLRRSAASVPTNIVEGYKRRSDKDYARFINIAEGSLEETKYHLLLARDLDYLQNDQYNELINICEEIGKMLFGLYKKLKT
ncbi:MAG: four helix bundle protein [Parcubacteria group bacterium]